MVLSAVFAVACGGSTAVETVVGPDTRCQTTLAGPSAPVSPNGGTVSVSVTAARDCAWTAASEASWMQLNATSGQGNATLTVNVARNDVPSARSGAVAVNTQRVTIAQEARPCSFALSAAPQSLSSDPGAGAITVETPSGCAWTAVSSAEWLRVLTPSGSGPATIPFEVTANTGAAREARVTIGGQSITIGQQAAQPGGGPACTISLSPPVVNASAAAGTHSVALAASLPSCEWSAGTSHPAWLTVAPTLGRGSATLTLTVARNTGNARMATVTAGNATTTVNQAAMPACTLTIDPMTASFPANGGEGRVQVNTQEGCDWTVSSAPSWAPAAPDRGVGNGEVRYSVAANQSTSARSATLNIGGRNHQITQAGAAPTCTFSVQPTSHNFAHTGGANSFTVTPSQPTCAWTASRSAGAEWLTVSGGATGNGSVSFTAAANPATSTRSTTITVSGTAGGSATFTVTQDAAPAPACTFSLQPTSHNFPQGGGSNSFTVTPSQPTCAWTASRGAGAEWLTVSGGATGNGSVSFTAAANPATSTRSATITVSGTSGGSATFTVTQDAAPPPTCTFSLQPTSHNFPQGGGSSSFSVTPSQPTCSWTASRGAGGEWLTVSGAATGNGSVTFSAPANTATATRSTTITVNGTSGGSATFTVTQDAAPPPTCTFSLQPTSHNFPHTGGSSSFTVTPSQPTCSWTASRGAGGEWLTVSGGATGNGSVTFSAPANTATAPRSTTITVNGASGGSATFTVTQDAAPAQQACTYTIDPNNRDFGPAGGPGTVQLATGATCGWTASENADWIVLASAGGTGPGPLSYTVSRHGGDDRREATITVAGLSHRVRQEGEDDDDVLLVSRRVWLMYAHSV